MVQPVNAATPSAAAAAPPAGKGTMTDDQCFLLTVIFGIYFGPHVNGERPPHRSAMQRIHERMPQYTQDQLAGSKMKVAQMMHVYYYILRKASQSVIVAPSLLLEFFRGTLPAKVFGPSSSYPRFIDLFPTDLHTWSFVEEQFMVIDSIAFINSPSASYLREEAVLRFKSLTGLQEFVLEKDAAKLPIYVTDEAFYEVVAGQARSEGRSHFSVPPRCSNGRKRKSDEALNIMPLQMVPCVSSPSSRSSRFSRASDTFFKAQLDPKVVFSPLRTIEMQCRGAVTDRIHLGVAGNADVGLTESITRHANLAESDDCYLFQVSLPGVRRDQTFSCELNMSGEILIEGETATDEKVVESRTGNLFPSGHFSLSFQLPGCVDARRSNCNFGLDGIFEGVVKKLINNG